MDYYEQLKSQYDAIKLTYRYKKGENKISFVAVLFSRGYVYTQTNYI